MIILINNYTCPRSLDLSCEAGREYCDTTKTGEEAKYTECLRFQQLTSRIPVGGIKPDNTPRFIFAQSGGKR